MRVESQRPRNGNVVHMADERGRCVADGEVWPCGMCRRSVGVIEIEVGGDHG